MGAATSQALRHEGSRVNERRREERKRYRDTTEGVRERYVLSDLDTLVLPSSHSLKLYLCVEDGKRSVPGVRDLAKFRVPFLCLMEFRSSSF